MNPQNSFLSSCQITLVWLEMGRPVNPSPTYVYKEKDKARIYWRGEFRDLPGRFRSAKSLAAYQSLCQIVEATGSLPPKAHESETVTIKDLGKRYLAAMRVKFGPESNEPTYRSYAVKEATKLFGGLPVAEFLPPQLKAVRQVQIDQGKVRRTANKRAQQLIKMIQWAVEEGLATSEQWQRLKAVEPIGIGQFGSKDKPKKRPVPDNHFEAVLKAVKPRTADALRVLALSGMRTGELLAMRPQDVDMRGRHWFYIPPKHKTQAKTGDKLIAIPESAAKILQNYLPRDYTRRFFPLGQSWLLRAVERACKRADVPHWHPHQLRHLLASRVAEKDGKESAQALLAHADLKMTEHYIEESKKKLTEIMNRMEEGQESS